MTSGGVHVLDGGFLTTVQDAAGRLGLGRFGIPPGGAMDPDAARLANWLVGNGGEEPLLEMTLHGPVLRFATAAHLGLAGADLGGSCEHLRLTPGFSHRIPEGAVLRFERSVSAGRGARAYLAVQGGFAIEPVLGSASTDRRSAFGGLAGRELQAGDFLRFRATQTGPLRSSIAEHPGPSTDPLRPVEIRMIPSPEELLWFGPDGVSAVTDTTWTVAPESDRNGIRLRGGYVPTLSGRIASVGVPVGSMQVPPSGEPIITMVDGPVTGGYPVVGVVPRLDRGRLAQLAPGASVRFRQISVEAARKLEHAVADAASRDRIEIDLGDIGAAWAGG